MTEAIFALAWLLSLKAAHDYGWVQGSRFSRNLFASRHLHDQREIERLKESG